MFIYLFIYDSQRRRQTVSESSLISPRRTSELCRNRSAVTKTTVSLAEILLDGGKILKNNDKIILFCSNIPYEKSWSKLKR